MINDLLLKNNQLTVQLNSRDDPGSPSSTKGNSSSCSKCKAAQKDLLSCQKQLQAKLLLVSNLEQELAAAKESLSDSIQNRTGLDFTDSDCESVNGQLQPSCLLPTVVMVDSQVQTDLEVSEEEPELLIDNSIPGNTNIRFQEFMQLKRENRELKMLLAEYNYQSSGCGSSVSSYTGNMAGGGRSRSNSWQSQASQQQQHRPNSPQTHFVMNLTGNNSLKPPAPVPKKMTVSTTSVIGGIGVNQGQRIAAAGSASSPSLKLPRVGRKAP
jgi:hypothetical protein